MQEIQRIFMSFYFFPILATLFIPFGIFGFYLYELFFGEDRIGKIKK